MNIVAPVSRISDVMAVIEAGADEIYCGLLTNDQLDNYTNINCLNRRSEPSSNITSYSELKEVIKIARSKNIPINFTLNEFYNQEQTTIALRQLEKILECGIKRFIVSDLGLLHEIRKRKYPDLKLHISSCASILNSEAMRYYKDFNPSRIILNRQLSLSEIDHMRLQFPTLEMEVIILNERCHYIDGMCGFLHGRLSPAYNLFVRSILEKISNRDKYPIPRFLLKKLHLYVLKNNNSCCFPYHVQYCSTRTVRGRKTSKEKIFFNKAGVFLQACGLCAIYDFYKIGIKYFKISGRSLLAETTMAVKLVKEAANIVRENLTKNDSQERIKDIARNKYRKACSPEYCYYCDNL